MPENDRQTLRHQLTLYHPTWFHFVPLVWDLFPRKIMHHGSIFRLACWSSSNGTWVADVTYAVVVFADLQLLLGGVSFF